MKTEDQPFIDLAYIQFEPRISRGKFKNKYFLVVIGMTMSLKGINTKAICI